MKWYWWVIIIQTLYIFITGFGFVFGWLWEIIKEFINESKYLNIKI